MTCPLLLCISSWMCRVAGTTTRTSLACSSLTWATESSSSSCSSTTRSRPSSRRQVRVRSDNSSSLEPSSHQMGRVRSSRWRPSSYLRVRVQGRGQGQPWTHRQLSLRSRLTASVVVSSFMRLTPLSLSICLYIGGAYVDKLTVDLNIICFLFKLSRYQN